MTKLVTGLDTVLLYFSEGQVFVHFYYRLISITKCSLRCTHLVRYLCYEELINVIVETSRGMRCLPGNGYVVPPSPILILRLVRHLQRPSHLRYYYFSSLLSLSPRHLSHLSIPRV